MKVPCDVVLTIIESRLDESLSTLEGDKPRLARKQLDIEREFGSVQAFVEAVKDERGESTRATL